MNIDDIRYRLREGRFEFSRHALKRAVERKISDEDNDMKCDVCGNTTFHNRQVEEVFHIEGHLVMVEGIPARVCDRCGDATFDRQTTEAIRRMVHGKKRPTRREEVDVFAFA